MDERRSPTRPFDTVAMAQILLDQHMMEEASEMIRRLVESSSEDPRTAALLARIEEKTRLGETEQVEVARQGIDSMILRRGPGSIEAGWELTDEGLGIARRRVRYSGIPIIRLFTAAAGPRGVRKTYNDVELVRLCARQVFPGLPRPAIHVAAVGFLGNNGAFVPLARSTTLSTDP